MKRWSALIMLMGLLGWGAAGWAEPYDQEGGRNWGTDDRTWGNQGTFNQYRNNYQEDYDAEGGFNWFGGDDGEQLAPYDADEGFYGGSDDFYADYDYQTNDPWFDNNFEEGDLYEPVYGNVDTGLYESTDNFNNRGVDDGLYDWNSNDDWYDDWYGDSDWW